MLDNSNITGDASHRAPWRRWHVIRFALLCVLAACETVPLTPPEESGDPPTEQPPEEQPQPSSPSITLTPSQVTLQGIGNTIQLIATAETSPGQADPNPDLTWTSDNSNVASVNTSGLVTADGAGTTFVIVTYESLADTATINVEDDGTPPPPPPPPPTTEWDQELANVTIEGDVVVPDGKAWLIGPNVEIAGNLRTEGGTIGMRPGSSLRFLGADPNEYVGGGMKYGPDFERDIGLWVSGDGVLDIRGTPKVGWNRTGTHETWGPDDEYWIAPTDADDHTPRRWYPGDPIPQVDPRVPPAEIMNVTRDIVIEGPAHIHIHSNQPQTIEYVRLLRMGVSSASFEGPVLGRYALHLHVSGDGTRGTVIRGVAAVESQGRVYVPHASHGVTMIDNVSVNSFAEGFWWDEGDETNDLLVDRLAVSGVFMPEEINDNSRYDAVSLGAGTNMVMSNSAASGARDNKLSIGFMWDSKQKIPSVWEFSEGNVGHNNSGSGIRFWTNSGQDHHPRNAILYRNGIGIENGAYKNGNRYTDVLVLQDLVGIRQNSNSGNNESDDGPGRYERVHVEAAEGPALKIGERNVEATTYQEFIDCTLLAGPGAAKVYVTDGGNPWLARFHHSGVVPDDFEFETLDGGNDGSHIIIEHEDGRVWDIHITGGQKVVTLR